MNEYEKLAMALLSSSQGAKLLGNLDKISSVLDAPESKKLISMLAGSGGDALKQAAREAADGNDDQARKFISALLSTKEGAQVASQLMEIIKQQ